MSGLVLCNANLSHQQLTAMSQLNIANTATYQTSLDSPQTSLPLATLQLYGNAAPLRSKFDSMIEANDAVLLEATRCPTCREGLLKSDIRNHSSLQTETIAGTEAAVRLVIKDYRERILEIVPKDLENLRGGYKKLEAAVKEGAKGFVCKEE
jgi:hypothetical protein